MHASLFIVEDLPGRGFVCRPGTATGRRRQKAASCMYVVGCCRSNTTDGIGMGPVILHKIRASVRLHITVAGQQYSQRTVAVVALQDTGVLLLFKLHCSDIVVSLLPCSVTVSVVS